MMKNNIEFQSILPSELPVSKFFSLMLGAIGPRPIAFVSSLDAHGRPNLAPFSFFNGFGANPPILIFSPSRRGRDNTTKHTYDNVKQVPEVVINVVNYSMVEQVSLASSDYPEGINEFEKVGFTALASDLIKPFRVKESPVQFECKVINVVETGTEGSAGNLVICEILKVHINPEFLQPDGQLDQQKLDLVGRMGGNWYVRANGDALFEVEKPLTTPGIGVDSLPEHARFSKVLTGNDLGKLGNLKSIPSDAELKELRQSREISEALDGVEDSELMQTILHHMAQSLIAENKLQMALQVLFLHK